MLTRRHSIPRLSLALLIGLAVVSFAAAELFGLSGPSSRPASAKSPSSIGTGSSPIQKTLRNNDRINAKAPFVPLSFVAYEYSPDSVASIACEQSAKAGSVPVHAGQSRAPPSPVV